MTLCTISTQTFAYDAVMDNPLWEYLLFDQIYATLVIVIPLMCLILIHYFLWIPMNKFVDLEEKGRLNIVEKARKRRALGDMPPSYPNGWFVLLESSDLKVADVKHVALLGEHFAVFRGKSGVVHILDAYCPHLGANMGEGGTVKGDCLECPFHKWSFDGSTGSCKNVPYSEDVPAFVKAKTWPSAEVNGFIFVWYHAEGEQPTWKIKPNECVSRWRFHGRTEFVVSCHIQDIPENGADVGHLNALHGASLLTGSNLREIERPAFQFMRHLWKASWQASKDQPHVGLMALQHQTTLFGFFQLGWLDIDVQQVGPGYVELAMEAPWGPMVLLQTVTPISPLKQRVLHRIYSPWCTAPFTKMILWAETIMFTRDVMVWNHKTYIAKPIFVKGDKYVMRHRRWYSQFYSANSPQFSFQKDTLYW